MLRVWNVARASQLARGLKQGRIAGGDLPGEVARASQLARGLKHRTFRAQGRDDLVARASQLARGLKPSMSSPSKESLTGRAGLTARAWIET